MKNGIKYLMIVFVCLGCKHDKEMVGPTLNDVFGTFSITAPLQASVSTVSFSTGETVTFTAGFTKIVNWKLTIKGLTSGITKTITGKSKDLNSTNALWKGTADHPGFVNENVEAILTFDDYNDTLTTTVNINSSKDYSGEGVLVSDFESGTAGFGTYNEAGEVSSNQILSDMNLGGKVYNIEGTDNNANWFLGLVGIPATVEHSPAIHYPITTTDADDVYFNVFVYGYGNNNTVLAIDFQEDDSGDSNPGVYDDAGDDTWSKSINVNWTGWKLVSFKLSETARSTQAAFGGSGNGIREIDRILKVQFVLLSQNGVNTSAVRNTFDFPIFTIGNPFAF